MFTAALFGGTKVGNRPWRPGKRLWALTAFGGLEMDFRQAQLEEGTTHMTCVTLFGGTKLRVPRGLPVTVGGLTLLGGKEVKSRAQAEQTPSPSALYVGGLTLFGGLEVTDRTPDEES